VIEQVIPGALDDLDIEVSQDLASSSSSSPVQGSREWVTRGHSASRYLRTFCEGGQLVVGWVRCVGQCLARSRWSFERGRKP
jgi:hypothetical protein